jgi:hypothetical protein
MFVVYHCGPEIVVTTREKEREARRVFLKHRDFIRTEIHDVGLLIRSEPGKMTIASRFLSFFYTLINPENR